MTLTKKLMMKGGVKRPHQGGPPLHHLRTMVDHACPSGRGKSSDFPVRHGVRAFARIRWIKEKLVMFPREPSHLVSAQLKRANT